MRIAHFFKYQEATLNFTYSAPNYQPIIPYKTENVVISSPLTSQGPRSDNPQDNDQYTVLVSIYTLDEDSASQVRKWVQNLNNE
jgi:hypothetical protein